MLLQLQQFIAETHMWSIQTKIVVGSFIVFLISIVLLRVIMSNRTKKRTNIINESNIWLKSETGN